MIMDFDPVVPSLVPYQVARSWLEINLHHVREFVRDYYGNSWADIKDFAFQVDGPQEAYHIVADWLAPNDMKLQWTLYEFFRKPRIALIVGDRGAGKTAFAHRMMEFALERGLTPYFMGALPEVPPGFRWVVDLLDVPPDSIVFVDELTLWYNSRQGNTSKERVQDLFSLPISRQNNVWYLVGLQSSAMADVNFPRLADVVIWKTVNPLALRLDRGAVVKQVNEFLIPRIPEKTYFAFNDRACTVEVGLSSTWKEDYSFPYRKPKDVVAYVSWLNFAGVPVEKITKELNFRLVRVDDKDVREMLTGV